MISEIWTEKYRPSKFSELVGQEEIVKRVKSLTNAMNIPHLLFAGPAGTGKSTLALIVVKELYGKNWKDNYLELNASDERGISIVREKVKKSSSVDELASRLNGYRDKKYESAFGEDVYKNETEENEGDE